MPASEPVSLPWATNGVCHAAREGMQCLAAIRTKQFFVATWRGQGSPYYVFGAALSGRENFILLAQMNERGKWKLRPLTEKGFRYGRT